MFFHRPVSAAIAALCLVAGGARAADGPAEGLKMAVARGELLFLANCTICHGATGLGVKGTYPPLAGSDWLAANRDGAIRTVVSGLKGEITVNGQRYNGQMPAVIIDDAQVADTLTYVLNTWGNPGGRVSEEDVRTIRRTTAFPTFAALKAAGDFRPLPAPPPGFTLQEIARLPDFATRLASDGKGGKLFVLGQGGTVWRYDGAAGSFKPLIQTRDFGPEKPGNFQTYGITVDAEGRLWISANYRIEGGPLVLNEVTIFRTTTFDAEGDPIAPAPWYRTRYPYGIGSFNHGISDLKFGPDGMLYVSSGSRTDSGEPGGAPNFGKMGEVDITAAMWRMDPKTAAPRVEVIARGIRNAYSFAWDGHGNLFTVSNGPDAHAPEEMDHVVPPRNGAGPRHHGFPFQFAGFPASRKWYPHTPDAPAGLEFVAPVVNLGPAALMGARPTGTFTPHSSPLGLVWLGGDWPEPVRNSFLVGRFGNLLPGFDGDDAGFDVLSMKLEHRTDGGWAARTTTLLAPLGRPIDVHLAGPGRIYILEYTRVTDFKSQLGRLPGRILELAVARPAGGEAAGR